MRNLSRQLIAACIVASFGASVALACGIDFPWQLLDNRAAALDTMPLDKGSFAWAEAHLVPANDKLIPSEIEYSYGEPHNDAIANAVANAEVKGLSSDQADALRKMRAEANGESAFNKGALLPAAVRLYAAGAVDFHKSDTNAAMKRFHAVLELPPYQRRDREVWAAYMLGRIYSRKGHVAEASKWFGTTRALANNGAPDPLGLGVASYGEEARLHLDRVRALAKVKKRSSQQTRTYSQEIADTIRLYARQAAHGSTIGIDSMGSVVDEVRGDDAAVAASICDPLVQKLLVTRALDGDAEARDNPDTPPTSQISTLARSVRKCGSGNLTAADQLAAIAYRDGDYQLAQSLASQVSSPLAMWVKARLAMQKGDVGEAAKYYAAASKAFPSAGEQTETLLAGESGVLTLARGEYVDALEQLYPYSATFWGDVAYIAERVLTVDELKTFVDTHKDTKVTSAVSLDYFAIPASDDLVPWPSLEDGRSAADQLRDLLARRLVRAGRYQEALKYFSSPDEGTAAEYTRALSDASTARSSVDRARGWYRAAALAGDFNSGNEIMGTEGSPDYLNSPFDSGAGQSRLRPDDQFVTDGERQRFKASAPKPDFRYHYRFVGVDEALRAAALLPARSQAFAAVLCHATRYVTDGKSCPARAEDLRASPTAYGSNVPSIVDPLTVDVLWSKERTARNNLTCQLYQRYLKEGAALPWATHFGRHCPEPDFVSAVNFAQTQASRDARRHSQMVRHRWIVLMKLALVALCLGASTWWFLRHRYV